ncbi:MAG: hypothetical protein KGQ70_08960 [Alphaproteobacteria bacterium]|nr:hypothetical protein [Alphaproteobacteria bacterium]
MIVFSLVAGGVIAFLVHMEFLGRAAAENDAKGEILDDIEKADAARASVEHDAAADSRVRDAFTR